MTAPVENTVVAANGLGMRFGSLQALDGVCFRIAAGSITGLVGPNGAGKTTLIRILATLLVPTAGTAQIAGFDVVRSFKDVRRRIGYFPDFPGAYQDMTVEEYLRFFANAHGLNDREGERFIERCLALSGLDERAKHFVEELSHGMRAKLSFVRALAGDPRLLLLDEPLSNLDPMARADFLALLTRMRDEGRSVLISSHILTDLEKICDHVIFISKGRLVEEKGGTAASGLLYKLRASGEQARVIDALGGINGILSAKPEQSPGCFLIELSSGADPAAALKAAVEAGVAVLEWRPALQSLEERLVNVIMEDRS